VIDGSLVILDSETLIPIVKLSLESLYGDTLENYGYSLTLEEVKNSSSRIEWLDKNCVMFLNEDV